MLSVPVPKPDDSLVSLLREAHVSQFVPKNKTIIVDESLTKEDEQGKNLLLFSVFYTTLLLLPPLRFHCIGGCWDRIQDSCDFGISC